LKHGSNHDGLDEAESRLLSRAPLLLAALITIGVVSALQIVSSSNHFHGGFFSTFTMLSNKHGPFIFLRSNDPD
jgi:hypothetical protein